MGLLGQFLKVVILLGIVGAIAYFIYQKSNEGPMRGADVKTIAMDIAVIIGEEKTELTTTDKPSVEFQVGKLNDASLETIRDGLCLLDPGTTRAQYIAAELILLRIYEQRPDGYVSRVDGEPWDVSGDLSQMGPFEMDRTPGDKDSVINMVMAFGPSVKVREKWAAAK